MDGPVAREYLMGVWAVGLGSQPNEVGNRLISVSSKLGVKLKCDKNQGHETSKTGRCTRKFSKARTHFVQSKAIKSKIGGRSVCRSSLTDADLFLFG